MADCFVARQPIFDRDNEVYAYELLYRSGSGDEIGSVNRTVATSRVIISAFVDIGLDNIVGNRLAILNITDSFLHDPGLACFPPAQVVLSLPSNTADTDENREAIDRLKRDGYRIALNGYRESLPIAALLPYADIVYLDALDLDNEMLRRELETLEGLDLVRVAKRVDSADRRLELEAMGVECFQGYYLTRPELVSGRRLPTNRMAVLQLVTKLNDPDTTADELDTLIAMDPALSLRILRFVNSPLSGLTNEVESIHHAVVLLGRNVIKNWVMLLALSSLSNTVPELIVTAFVRARFCEQLATEAGLAGKDSYFTVGLFSLMDAMMATSMEDLVDSLPFIPEIKSALTAQTGTHGEAILCARRFEEGAFSQGTFQDLPGDRIADLYLDSLTWADNTTGALT